MRTAFLFFTLLLLSPFSLLRAQETDPVQRNALHLELGGNGGLFSLNYERLVAPTAALRLGIAEWESKDFLGDGDTRIIVVPFTVSHMPKGWGKGWEIGMGVTVGHKKETEPGWRGDGPRASEGTAIVDLTGIAGYRWRSAGGLMIRLVFTPFLPLAGDYPDDGFFPSAGLSIGFDF